MNEIIILQEKQENGTWCPTKGAWVGDAQGLALLMHYALVNTAEHVAVSILIGNAERIENPVRKRIEIRPDGTRQVHKMTGDYVVIGGKTVQIASDGPAEVYNKFKATAVLDTSCWLPKSEDGMPF